MFKTIYLTITIITIVVYAMIIHDAIKVCKEKYGESKPEYVKNPTLGAIISSVIGIILICIIPILHIVVMFAILGGYEKTVDGIVNNVDERIKVAMEAAE